ncbi:MAG: hypothetical protein LAN71_12230 [Acidobacteriia bacterium]|nr:hypothetical protein [Terriglobia bacterium]
MRRRVRWTVGGCALLFAAFFLFLALRSPHKPLILLALPPFFCLLIAAASFSDILHKTASRIIGLAASLLSLAYLVIEIRSQPWSPYPGLGEPHWLHAALAFLVFGLPGIYVAVRGEYPAWGKAARGLPRGKAACAQNHSHGA